MLDDAGNTFRLLCPPESADESKDQIQARSDLREYQIKSVCINKAGYYMELTPEEDQSFPSMT
jgi:hypothetical protein